MKVSCPSVVQSHGTDYKIYKIYKICIEKIRKDIPKMKEKVFLRILNQNFPGGACPWNPLSSWALWVCNYPLGVTPVTTAATAVQNSIENPALEMCLFRFALRFLEVH